MTIFEYLAIAYSLVVSFTVLRALSGLPRASSGGQIYWVHLVWICVILGTAFQYFWGFWAFRAIEWTQLKFLLVLANPALLYVMACILTPESPASADSWKHHFYSVRVQFFLIGICFQLVSIATLVMIIDLGFDDLVLKVQVALVPVWMIGAYSSRPAIHAGIVGVVVATLVLGAFTYLATVS